MNQTNPKKSREELIEEKEEEEQKSRSQRQSNILKINEDIEEIDGVRDTGHSVRKPHYVDGELHIFLEREDLIGKYRIDKDLRELNREIKEVLSKHDDKHVMKDVGFKSPEREDEKNVYERDVYFVEVTMK